MFGVERFGEISGPSLCGIRFFGPIGPAAIDGRAGGSERPGTFGDAVSEEESAFWGEFGWEEFRSGIEFETEDADGLGGRLPAVVIGVGGGEVQDERVAFFG